MQKLKAAAQSILEKYASLLAAKGLVLSLSSRYFEVAVEEYSSLQPGLVSHLVDAAVRTIDRKIEKAKGYRHERNRYHSLILCVMPLDGSLKREYCKNYAFPLRKVERSSVGLPPERVEFRRDKLLKKIEKRILKILKRAERRSPEKVCRDTVCDALRYTSVPKYQYRQKILGQSRYSWELKFILTVGLIALLGVLVAWGIHEYVR